MKYKENESLLDYSKHMKQGKEIFESYLDKDKLENYAENLKELKNTTEAHNNKNIKPEKFIKLMVYLLITNWYQLKYDSLENEPASQYSTKKTNTPRT